MEPVTIACIIVAAIAAAIAAIVAIVKIVKLTLPKLKKYLKERRMKKHGPIVFTDTKETINKHADEILQQAPTMTMEELKKLAEEKPYLVCDTDDEREHFSDWTEIQAEEVGPDLVDLLKQEGGIIVFD